MFRSFRGGARIAPHWCRRRVRFNQVPEKVWEALVQRQGSGSTGFPGKVSEKVWEALVQSQVRFNRVLEKVPEKVLGGFGAEPGQFGRARSGSTGFAAF